MAKRRTYGEACGIPRALDRVGERWSLMIVRELVLGPKRFTDIRAALPGLSPDILAQRLRDLEEAGVLTREVLPPPAASKVYQLTEWGHELEPVLIALGRWGARAPGPPPDACMSFDSHILSLLTLFDAKVAGDFETKLQLHLDKRDFRAEVSDGTLEIEPGSVAEPDATVTATADAFVAIAHGRRQLDEAIAAGDLAIDGDAAAVERFLGLFPLPEPAPPPLAAPAA
jgi:DNA-binding HxlR family transcriptional regulator